MEKEGKKTSGVAAAALLSASFGCLMLGVVTILGASFSSIGLSVIALFPPFFELFHT